VFRSSPYSHVGGDEVSSGRPSRHAGYKAFGAEHGPTDDHLALTFPQAAPAACAPNRSGERRDQGIITTEPTVRRPSRSRCTRPASATG
jgi:hypothetical protein